MFATRNGTKMSAGNVRREFRRVISRAGLVSSAWTPREMRHRFVSLLSADGVPVENIARLIGHGGGSAVTGKIKKAAFPFGRRPSSWWAILGSNQ
ncbi:tyrosine-type recombinase/integrase [Nonomuraea sp. LPB2021202275-12-8]|uniref:tyrosine-type recombinase/integrase n=1 Tax=Nonomuraea sp. LPB2021202275-12-8 TaxID=3120159 RepID=UPI00300C21FD